MDKYIQNTEMKEENYVDEKTYWENKLNKETIISKFPPNIEVCVPNKKGIEMLSSAFSEDISQRLIFISKESEYALYMLLLSGVSYLLYKYNGYEDIIIGMPEFKQINDSDDTENIIVLQNTVNVNGTFKDFITEIKCNVMEADRFKKISFFYIADLLQLQAENDRYVIDTVVMLENIHKAVNTKNIKANMLFSFVMKDKSIEMKVFYDSDNYTEEFVEQIICHMNNYFQEMVNDTNKKLSEIDIMSHEEKKSILEDFNNTYLKYPRESNISKLFEEQVLMNHDRIAVVTEEKGLTYNELNDKCNNLADLLREKGLQKNCVAGIMVKRSNEMLVGSMGIIKAGGAYMPINSSCPEKRVLSMMDDSEASILITQDDVIKRYSYTTLQGLGSRTIKPVSTSSRPQIKDFDSIPIPDRSLVDYEKYNKYIGQGGVKNSIAINATRGCPYQCAYCHKIWPKFHVTRSAESIFNEINIYYQMGIKRFVFIDDIFNLDIKNSSRFFYMVIDSGMKIHISFPNGLRGDILTKEYIDLMIKAGTVNFAVALETASPRLQKLIGKNLDIEKLRENLKYITEVYPNVIVDLFTMHGFPTETEEEALMTLDFIKSINWIHFPVIDVLKIYSDSDMAKLAIENGISREAIEQSMDLAYHELPETLPFSKSFAAEYQSRFLNEYFLSKERLLQVLPVQMKILTEDELVQKYNNYLPVSITSFSELLDFIKISPDELSDSKFLERDFGAVANFNDNLKNYFPRKTNCDDSFKILFIDLSLNFTSDRSLIYDIVEPPLGLMYLLTYLNNKFGDKIYGKIIKARVDFDNYEELKELFDNFKPNLICVRSLTYYRDFFHKTISLIRQWGVNVPILAGGPYATSDWHNMLKDKNIDLAVLGEGEITITEVVEKILKNGGKLPSDEVLETIPGVAFVENKDHISIHEFGRQIILLDKYYMANNEKLASYPKVENQPNDLAYVMFTSGSTGKPKGVMIEHRNVINLVYSLKEIVYKRYSPHLNVALLAPYEFDASIQQIFSSLLMGHKLFIVPEEVRMDGARIIEFYKKNSIEISDGTPIHLSMISNALHESGVDMDVKHFIIGGEVLGLQVLKNFYTKFYKNTPEVTNIYGPTECCVDSVSYLVNREKLNLLRNVPIGKPLGNTRVYVLNKNLEVLPIGVVGELYIAGEGVGKGYIGNSYLTEERYLDDPFVPGNKMYKTGDLVKWLKDGNIEFVGRSDFQVKIRGLRIELGEIEAKLLEHPKIKNAVVVVRGDRSEERYLCAYIIAECELTVQELRGFLTKEMPEYMIPSHFILLDRFPLSMNGKINRNELPQPGSECSRETGFLTANNEIEEKLIEVWKEVLYREDIGVDQIFFELGGNSLNLLQVSSKIDQLYPGKVTVTDLFSYPTIRKLSQFIEKEKIESVRYPKLSHIELQSEYFLQDFQEADDSTVLRFNIDKSILKDISDIVKYNEVELEDIFLAIYMYLFAKASKQQQITVQAALEENDYIFPCTLQLSNTESIFDLFSQIAYERNNRDKTKDYNINSFKNYDYKKTKGYVIPLIFRSGLLSVDRHLFRIYDIIISYNIADEQSNFLFEYDSSRLNKDGVCKLANGYLRLLELVIAEYKTRKGERERWKK